MARCESIDVLRKIIMDTKMEDIESSELDSDSDISYILDLDMSGENDCNPDSAKSVSVCNEEQTNTGPVLSLKCLHDDNTDEENESSESYVESQSDFIDANDVPELLINDAPEDKRKHPYPVQVTGNSSSLISCISVTHPHSSIPARNNWEGVHNFKISVNCGELPKKTESSVYSESQNKLYVSKDHPFKVFVTAENVPVGSMIKVTAVFSLVEHSYEVVQRCPTHAQQDFIKGSAAYEHFVQCFSDVAFYEKNENGKLSVSVPYEKPQEGETYSTYLFKLTCFSSCSGGLNRRPFMLIFTLENDNIPLGRQILEAKVCACPLRDYRMETNKEVKRASKTKSKEPSQSLSPEKISSKYSIVVKDPELFLFLKQMKVLYETSAYSAKIISDSTL